MTFSPVLHFIQMFKKISWKSIYNLNSYKVSAHILCLRRREFGSCTQMTFVQSQLYEYILALTWGKCQIKPRDFLTVSYLLAPSQEKNTPCTTRMCSHKFCYVPNVLYYVLCVLYNLRNFLWRTNVLPHLYNDN